jgi:MOSC domain-containing protein YiiM
MIESHPVLTSATSATKSIGIRHLYISPDHNYFGHHGRPPGNHPIKEVATVECVAGKGLKGDRFFDYKENYKGQITFFAWETYEALCACFSVGDRPPSAFRRNVITSGVDLNTWIGREFKLQGIIFRGTEECRPCYWMDVAFANGAEDYLKKRGGLRAEILTTGILRVDFQ